MCHEMFREMLAENNYEIGWLRVMGLERSQRFLAIISTGDKYVMRTRNDCMTSGNLLSACCM